jgi:hypothetical protein
LCSAAHTSKSSGARVRRTLIATSSPAMNATCRTTCSSSACLEQRMRCADPSGPTASQPRGRNAGLETVGCFEYGNLARAWTQQFVQSCRVARVALNEAWRVNAGRVEVSAWLMVAFTGRHPAMPGGQLVLPATSCFPRPRASRDLVLPATLTARARTGCCSQPTAALRPVSLDGISVPARA